MHNQLATCIMHVVVVVLLVVPALGVGIESAERKAADSVHQNGLQPLRHSRSLGDNQLDPRSSAMQAGKRHRLFGLNKLQKEQQSNMLAAQSLGNEVTRSAEGQARSTKLKSAMLKSAMGNLTAQKFFQSHQVGTFCKLVQDGHADIPEEWGWSEIPIVSISCSENHAHSRVS